MPDPFGFQPTGIWGDEYRAMGGLVVPDVLEQQRAEGAARQQAYDDAMLQLGTQEQADVDRVRQEGYALSEQEFTDWPTYQQLVVDKTPPHQSYEDYISAVLPWQLSQMGYTPEEINR